MATPGTPSSDEVSHLLVAVISVEANVKYSPCIYSIISCATLHIGQLGQLFCHSLYIVYWAFKFLGLEIVLVLSECLTKL